MAEASGFPSSADYQMTGPGCPQAERVCILTFLNQNHQNDFFEKAKLEGYPPKRLVMVKCQEKFTPILQSVLLTIGGGASGNRTRSGLHPPQRRKFS
jgi:hypothetical protein